MKFLVYYIGGFFLFATILANTEQYFSEFYVYALLFTGGFFSAWAYHNRKQKEEDEENK